MTSTPTTDPVPPPPNARRHPRGEVACRNCGSPSVRVVRASSAKAGLIHPPSMAMCLLCGETWVLVTPS
ncbi:hypothetical protein [Agromyces sp. PvR057]|uniref:hypothetical protein n=1 Tax=Agromyces sp. PvR057 TaxID=3156403 RepID=UPI000E27188A